MEQIADIRTTLRYLSVRIIGSSYMFRNNESAVLSSTNFTTKMHKRHNALSFHRIRESIAVGICRFHYLPGELNPKNVLSKHWSYNDVWKLFCPLMFRYGDTAEVHKD